MLISARSVASRLSYNSSLVAKSAVKDFPVIKYMGATIEGASVDKAGDLFAVNKTHLMNLAEAGGGSLILGNDSSFFASSRFTRTLGVLVGDATLHTVWQKIHSAMQAPLFLPNAHMLQPNDMAISADESRIYLSGMNYAADTGDVWYYDVHKHVLKRVDLSIADPKIFRTNGIELSPDDKELYITSAQNSLNDTVIGAKIFRFLIEHETGIPQNPVEVIDLYETLAEKGLDGAKAQMDPDGMRIDMKGNLFISLNSFGAVLIWNINADPGSSKIITLETVKFPSNLELAGKEGKDLYVVGMCEGGLDACIDHYKHDIPGRAITNLRRKCSS